MDLRRGGPSLAAVLASQCSDDSQAAAAPCTSPRAGSGNSGAKSATGGAGCPSPQRGASSGRPRSVAAGQAGAPPAAADAANGQSAWLPGLGSPGVHNRYKSFSSIELGRLVRHTVSGGAQPGGGGHAGSQQHYALETRPPLPPPLPQLPALATSPGRASCSLLPAAALVEPPLQPGGRSGSLAPRQRGCAGAAADDDAMPPLAASPQSPPFKFLRQ